MWESEAFTAAVSVSGAKFVASERTFRPAAVSVAVERAAAFHTSGVGFALSARVLPPVAEASAGDVFADVFNAGGAWFALSRRGIGMEKGGI